MKESFITGSGNDFTIVSKSRIVDGWKNDSVVTLLVFSGTVTPNGIDNFHMAGAMLNDNGDSNGEYINAGKIRKSKKMKKNTYLIFIIVIMFGIFINICQNINF